MKLGPRSKSRKSRTPTNGKLHSPHGHDNCLRGSKKGVNSAEYCAFTRCRLHRYNLSTSMARQRRNPAALDNPRISIVIPVYNEKNTIDEILRRVVDTEIRKEVIIVDDCSTDGTRQILENMAARQANGEVFAPAQDGNDAIELRDLRFFFQAPN